MRNAIVNALLVVVCIVAPVCAVEGFARYYNKAVYGRYFDFMYSRLKVRTAFLEFGLLDSLLGYAHSAKDMEETAPAFPWRYKDGFGVYGVDDFSDFNELPRPRIVILGGSTSDPLMGGIWPRQLYAKMRDRGFPGVVLNGAVGGYATSEELLKFVRDVLEVKPDVVVLYHGVNDRHMPMPFPMVNHYYRELLENIVLSGGREGAILPNTVFLFGRIMKERDRAKGKFAVGEITHGTPTGKSRAEYFIKNSRSMRALAAEHEIRLINILQPFADTGGYADMLRERHHDFWARWVRDFAATMPHYAMVREEDCYGEIKRKFPRSEYHDLTGLFDEIADSGENVYTDWCHTTPSGNEIIAGAVYRILEDGRMLGE